MGCFFAQNLTVFEKPKPKDQSERDAVKPSVFAAMLRTGVHEGTVEYGPLRALVNNDFEHMGLSITP
jgi:hypothetical protein